MAFPNPLHASVLPSSPSYHSSSSFSASQSIAQPSHLLATSTPSCESTSGKVASSALMGAVPSMEDHPKGNESTSSCQMPHPTSLKRTASITSLIHETNDVTHPNLLLNGRKKPHHDDQQSDSVSDAAPHQLEASSGFTASKPPSALTAFSGHSPPRVSLPGQPSHGRSQCMAMSSPEYATTITGEQVPPGPFTAQSSSHGSSSILPGPQQMIHAVPMTSSPSSVLEKQPNVIEATTGDLTEKLSNKEAVFQRLKDVLKSFGVGDANSSDEQVLGQLSKLFDMVDEGIWLFSQNSSHQPDFDKSPDVLTLLFDTLRDLDTTKVKLESRVESLRRERDGYLENLLDTPAIDTPAGLVPHDTNTAGAQIETDDDSRKRRLEMELLYERTSHEAFRTLLHNVQAAHGELEQIHLAMSVERESLERNNEALENDVELHKRDQLDQSRHMATLQQEKTNLEITVDVLRREVDVTKEQHGDLWARVNGGEFYKHPPSLDRAVHDARSFHKEKMRVEAKVDKLKDQLWKVREQAKRDADQHRETEESLAYFQHRCSHLEARANADAEQHIAPTHGNSSPMPPLKHTQATVDALAMQVHHAAVHREKHESVVTSLRDQLTISVAKCEKQAATAAGIRAQLSEALAKTATDAGIIVDLNQQLVDAIIQREEQVSSLNARHKEDTAALATLREEASASRSRHYIDSLALTSLNEQLTLAKGKGDEDAAMLVSVREQLDSALNTASKLRGSVSAVEAQRQKDAAESARKLELRDRELAAARTWQVDGSSSFQQDEVAAHQDDEVDELQGTVAKLSDQLREMEQRLQNLSADYQHRLSMAEEELPTFQDVQTHLQGSNEQLSSELEATKEEIRLLKEISKTSKELMTALDVSQKKIAALELEKADSQQLQSTIDELQIKYAEQQSTNACLDGLLGHFRHRVDDFLTQNERNEIDARARNAARIESFKRELDVMGMIVDSHGADNITVQMGSAAATPAPIRANKPPKAPMSAPAGSNAARHGYDTRNNSI